MWFSQICNIVIDPKLFKLRKEYPGDGLSVYIILKDNLMSNKKGVLNDDEIDIIIYCTPFQDPGKVKEIIKKCIELGIFDKDKEGNISSKEINADLEKYNKSIKKAIHGAQEKAKKYGSKYTFTCKDGDYTLQTKVYDKLKIQYPNIDELLEGLQTHLTENENCRVYKSRMKKEIELYLSQFPDC